MAEEYGRLSTDTLKSRIEELHMLNGNLSHL